MRELNELINVDNPAWAPLRELFAASDVPLRVLAVDEAEAHRNLLQLQVTARSVLGSLVLNCGGLILDDGWVRVYGGGSSGTDAGMPSLGQVNAFPAEFDPAWTPNDALIVGHDALGGVFALNGADPAAQDRPGNPGQMTYFAPDTLAWEAMQCGHSQWITWLLSGRLETFYDGTRWPNWREEAAALTYTQGITVFPPLWTKEARQDLAKTGRRAVPMREVVGVAADSAEQLGPGDPGFLGQF